MSIINLNGENKFMSEEKKIYLWDQKTTKCFKTWIDMNGM